LVEMHARQRRQKAARLRFEAATVTQVDPGTRQSRGIPPTDRERRCASGFGGLGLVVDGGTMFAAGDLLSLPPSWGALARVEIEHAHMPPEN
jgi:hypothetical protein